MTGTRWSCSEIVRPFLTGALVAAVAVGAPAPAPAQDDLDDACAAAASPRCAVAAAAVRLIHPRIGTALWGGNPVPGTASTLGMRLGSRPRISVSGRIALVPVELPPLLDAGRNEGSGALLPGVGVRATIGVLNGFSPMATVGGVFSVDAIAGLSWAALPSGDGFPDDAWGWAVGLRVGALRESFTLPGVSLTGSWARSTDVRFGDPEGATTDGALEGPISNLNATLAVTKRIARIGVTAGAAWDRYAGDVRVSYASVPGGPVTRLDAEAVTRRWSGFASATYTSLVFHTTVELGWQQAPQPRDVPATVSLDPAHLWVAFAFRVSI